MIKLSTFSFFALDFDAVVSGRLTDCVGSIFGFCWLCDSFDSLAPAVLAAFAALCCSWIARRSALVKVGFSGF